LSPGEVCKVSDTVNFTIDNVAITDPPEGNVVSFTSGTRKLIYRDKTTNEFVSATSSAERIFGRTSEGEVFASSSSSEGIVGPGVKTTTTGIVANCYWFDAGGTRRPSPSGGSQVGVGERSNVVIHFNQTMDPESFNFNAIDSITRDRYNILVSYDSNFQNTIPLSPTFTSSNNDTAFEFQPKILANSDLQLTQNMELFVKVLRNDNSITDNLKNKGDMNLSMTYDAAGYGSNVATSATVGAAPAFCTINASVFTEDGQEVELGLGEELSMPNISSTIASRTPIILRLNEVPLMSTWTYGGWAGAVVELTNNNSSFSGDHVAIGDGTITRVGEFGTDIMIVLETALTAGDRYYLRINSGAKSEGLEASVDAFYLNSFTIQN
jgi:hypothetical protein